MQIYEFENRELAESGDENRNSGPFAVVGSNEQVVCPTSKEMVRGRKYAWGTVVVDDPKHSDTALLRSLLLNSHLDELIDVTSNLHYEAYRRDALSSWLNVTKEMLDLDPELSLFGMVLKKKSQHEEKLQRIQKEMDNVFAQKVEEKMQKLSATESELREKGDHLRSNMEREENELANLKQKLQQEKEDFIRQHPHLEEQISRPILSGESFARGDGKVKKDKFPFTLR